MLATLLMAHLATGQAASLSIPHTMYKLDNGLEVILSEDHTLPLTAVNIWVHVGAQHERVGRSGFAHLFEHLMFQGSRNVANGQHLIELESSGATSLNATTGYDRINYFETVPSNQLEKVLWLESDRMGFLLDTLTQAKLDNQREVVKNERRQNLENVPYGPSQEKLVHMLYPEEHPYRGRVIGSMEHLNAATLDDVRDFFIDYYTPSNATLVIAGDFEPEHTRTLIERYFGNLPTRDRPKPRDIPDVTITSERRAEVQEPVQLARLEMAWHSPAFFKDGDAECDILAAILGQGEASRLYRRLVYDKQIAQTVSAYQSSHQLVSTFHISATARPGGNLKELEAEIEKVIDELKRTPPTAREVDRSRNRYLTQSLNGLQRLGGFGGRADVLNRYNHYMGNPDYLAEDLGRYEQVTPETVSSWARRLLTKNTRAVVWTRPRGES